MDDMFDVSSDIFRECAAGGIGEPKYRIN